MATISAPQAASAPSQTFDANCTSSAEVGDWVYITGPKVAGLFQVATADPGDILKIPAVGIIVSKTSATECVVQYAGPAPTGVAFGLTPGRVCFVAADGTTTQSPVGTYDPPVGVALDSGDLFIEVHFEEQPLPTYYSHYNTTDGTNNCTVPNTATTSRHVSNPNGAFGIGDWSPGDAHATTRASPLGYDTPGPCSVNNDTSTTFTALVRDGSGAVVAQNTITLTGNMVNTDQGVTITVSGWAVDYDKFRAEIDVDLDMVTILPNGGRFSVELRHDNGPEGTFSKTQDDVFYDKETNAAALSGVSVGETAGSVITRFLSGVEYYGLGSVFTVGISDIDDLNDESYPTDQVDVEGSEYGLPGLALSGPDLTGWSTDWDDDNDSFGKADWAITQVDLTARLTTANVRARTKDWANGAWVNSPDAAILVETHDDANSRITERWYYEDWRCEQSADFDAPAARGWTSDIDKGATDALYYGGGCEHNDDNWTPYNPNAASQPDYSGHVGKQYVIREFQHNGSASSGFSLSIPGSYDSFEYKLAAAWDGTSSGGTDWIDGEAAYNASLWNNGSPTGGSGGSLGGGNYTFGTNNIVNCGNSVYVRIGLLSGQRITGPLTMVFS